MMNSNPIEDSFRNGLATSMAALSVSMHTLRVMTNRGLVSPNELENINATFNETLEALGTTAFHGSIVADTAALMAEMRQLAKERFVGRDGPDPEKLGR